MVSDLLEHLGEAIGSLLRISGDDSTTDQNQESQEVRDAKWARLVAWTTATDIVSSLEHEFKPPSWIVEFVVDRVKRAVVLYRDRPIDAATGETVWETAPVWECRRQGFNVMRPDWLIEGKILAAALRLHRDGRLQVPTDFAVEVLMHPAQRWYPWPTGYRDAIDALTELDADTIRLITDQVGRISKEASNALNNSHPMTVLNTLYRADLFEVVGPIYAEHVVLTDEAVERWKKIYAALVKLAGEDQKPPADENYQTVLRILSSRSLAQGKDRDSAGSSD